MDRPNQESETRYRIVVDTPIPDNPTPGDYDSQYWQDYSAITLLKAYTGRDYETKRGAMQVVRNAMKGGPKYSCWRWPAPQDASLFQFHIEEATVTWNWKPVDNT